MCSHSPSVDADTTDVQQQRGEDGHGAQLHRIIQRADVGDTVVVIEVFLNKDILLTLI